MRVCPTCCAPADTPSWTPCPAAPASNSSHGRQQGEGPELPESVRPRSRRVRRNLPKKSRVSPVPGPGGPARPLPVSAGGRAGGSVSRLFPSSAQRGTLLRCLTEGPLRAGCGRRRLLATHLPPVRREGRRGAGKGRGGTGRPTGGRAFPPAGRGLAVREGGGGGPRSGREVLGLPWGRGMNLRKFFRKYIEFSFCYSV